MGQRGRDGFMGLWLCGLVERGGGEGGEKREEERGSEGRILAKLINGQASK